MKKQTGDPGVDVRREAARIIAGYRKTGANVDQLLQTTTEYGAVMQLVYGVIRHLRTLDWILKKRVGHIPEDMTGALLRIGIFQIVYDASAPDYAVVASVTEAARKNGETDRIVGFLNGVLRSFLRRRTEILKNLATRSLAVRESHPDILVQRWQHRFGIQTTRELCEWNNRPARVIVIPLPVSGGGKRYLERCRDAGIALSPHPSTPVASGALMVPHGISVTQLPGYGEGHFVVQDPATLKAVALLDVRPGQRVLDGCAAPGGKSIHISLDLKGTGKILAVEKNRARAQLLAENLRRCRVGRVEIRCADFLDLDAMNSGGKFDRILLDVPCSNTGVLRRRPDARWRFATESLEKLTCRQLRIVSHAPSLLAPGGRIVYSTCSLETEENQAIIDSFLAAHPDFRPAGTFSTHPVRDGVDGMFAAALDFTELG